MQVSEKLDFMKLLCACFRALLDRVLHQRVSNVCFVPKRCLKDKRVLGSAFLDKKVPNRSEQTELHRSDWENTR